MSKNKKEMKDRLLKILGREFKDVAPFMKPLGEILNRRKPSA